jgi:hypothetical protein
MAIKHKIRKNGEGETKIVTLNARKAIIVFCKECMGFVANDVRGCTSPLCPLYPFRVQGTPKDTV